MGTEVLSQYNQENIIIFKFRELNEGRPIKPRLANSLS
jgi:hypothetical protein